MAKVRTTLTIDQDVLKWVKIRAARTGVSDSAVIEESLRRDLKLDVLDELWGAATLSEAKASESQSRHNTQPGLGNGDLVRAVVDANVLISAVLSSRGPSSGVVRAARDGRFELIVSELLLTEFERAFGYPKLRKRLSAEKAAAYLSWVRSHGTVADDPAGPPPVGSPDPDDDYLLALAVDRRAFLVTGDQHLLGLRGELPIYPPAEFLRMLADEA